MDHGSREASKTAVALAETSTRIPASVIRLRAGLALDLGGCTLFRDSRVIPLTAQEERLLGLLLRAPGSSSASRSRRAASPGRAPTS